MQQLILTAIPFFLATMAVEALALRHAAHEDGPVGYERRDTRTSISMGLGHLFIGAAWKLVWTALLAAIYVASPVKLPTLPRPTTKGPTTKPTAPKPPTVPPTIPLATPP